MLAQELLADPGARSSLEARFEEGIIIGIVEESDEMVVSTNRGLILARNIKRRDPGSQWCAPAVMNVSVGPAKFYQHNNTRHHIPHTKSDPMRPTPAADADPESDPIPRSFRTNPDDYRIYGYTQGCPSCGNLQQGLGASSSGYRHTSECRERIREALA